jgi:hypothetical protein
MGGMLAWGPTGGPGPLNAFVVAPAVDLDFVAAKQNVVFLGPPGTGKTHLATGLGIRACHAGDRVAFATASQGSTGSPRPTTKASCKTSSDGWAATPCSSSTKSATSPSNPKRRTCSSNWCPPATNTPR